MERPTTCSLSRTMPAPATANCSSMPALSALIGPLTSIRLSLPFTRNGQLAEPGFRLKTGVTGKIGRFVRPSMTGEVARACANHPREIDDLARDQSGIFERADTQ